MSTPLAELELALAHLVRFRELAQGSFAYPPELVEEICRLQRYAVKVRKQCIAERRRAA